MVTIVNPSAFVGVQKNRKKVYKNNTVYLKDGQEFQIELHNPTQNIVGVKIWLNGKLSDDHILVLRPGEHIWLDRYLSENKKFKFSTYSVTDTVENKKAIQHNGLVRVEFYNQKSSGGISVTFNPWWDWKDVTHDSNWYTNTCNTSGGSIFYTDTNIGGSLDTPIGTFKANVPIKRNVETGRVEKGEISDQEFKTVDYEFESYTCHVVEYKLLPISQKIHVTTDDIKRFCTGCGMRVRKTNWKFCPNCGTNI